MLAELSIVVMAALLGLLCLVIAVDAAHTAFTLKYWKYYVEAILYGSVGIALIVSWYYSKVLSKVINYYL